MGIEYDFISTHQMSIVLVYTILKAPVSTVIFFKKSPYIFFKSTQRKMLKSGGGGGLMLKSVAGVGV
jgi:hypothetical protein